MFGTAEVAPVILVGAECEDLFSCGSETQVSVDNRENTFLVHQREQAWRNRVNSAKGERSRICDSTDHFVCAMRVITSYDSTTTEFGALVEEQITGRLTILGGKRSKGILFAVMAKHPVKIDGAEHIDVV